MIFWRYLIRSAIDSEISKFFQIISKIRNFQVGWNQKRRIEISIIFKIHLNHSNLTCIPLRLQHNLHVCYPYSSVCNQMFSHPFCFLHFIVLFAPTDGNPPSNLPQSTTCYHSGFINSCNRSCNPVRPFPSDSLMKVAQNCTFCTNAARFRANLHSIMHPARQPTPPIHPLSFFLHLTVYRFFRNLHLTLLFCHLLWNYRCLDKWLHWCLILQLLLTCIFANGKISLRLNKLEKFVNLAWNLNFKLYDLPNIHPYFHNYP